jgi:copper chaperone NosL
VKRALALAALLAAACASGPPAPAVLDTRNDACAWCRMAVSEARFAAQLVAPSEEPRFFDDVGCLGHFLAAQKTLPANAVAYVADHRTRAWVRAGAAVYTHVAALSTPMGSHLVAHADAASRDADADARGGTPRTLAEVFGAGGPPGGGP